MSRTASKSRAPKRAAYSRRRALERGQRGRWDGLRFARQFAQARASTLQRRLEDASSRDLAEFRQSVAEDINENHCAALRGREAHEGPQARDRRERVPVRIRRIGDHLQVLVVGKGGRLTRAPAEKIQGRVVSDPEQPSLGIGERPRAR
jgi:hypothetical protein